MIKRFVCVKNGVVDNIVMADQSFADGFLADQYDHVEHFADIAQEPRVGWLHVDGEYHEPNWNAEPEPAPAPQPEGGGQ